MSTHVQVISPHLYFYQWFSIRVASFAGSLLNLLDTVKDWILSPQNLYVDILTMRYLITGLCVGRGSLGRSLGLNKITGVGPNTGGRCPDKNRVGHIHRKCHRKTQGEDDHLQAKERGLQKCKKITSLFKPPRVRYCCGSLGELRKAHVSGRRNGSFQSSSPCLRHIHSRAIVSQLKLNCRVHFLLN